MTQYFIIAYLGIGAVIYLAWALQTKPKICALKFWWLMLVICITWPAPVIWAIYEIAVGRKTKT